MFRAQCEMASATWQHRTTPRRELVSGACFFRYVLCLSKSARWAKGVKVDG
jgi:hypothetical protein